ncbi:MAG: glycogen debranching protein GlgX [Bacteroidota bacterium]
MDIAKHEVQAGKSFPIGATVIDNGVNFCVYSKNATQVELLLFQSGNEPPNEVIKLDKEKNRTGFYWHIFIPGLQSGQLYGYRVDGPFKPEQGLRFDNQKVLLDPYAKSIVVPDTYDRRYAQLPGENTTTAMKSVVVDTSCYDWDDDERPAYSFSSTIIYELHVAGFTKHASSGLSDNLRGTYAGLIEKIPYLKELGITAVELLPVFQFDTQDAPEGKKNYWGYSPVSFFAPHVAYSSQKDGIGAVDEFKDMVKALHRAGIEVILDVVYNHTAEGGENGPTFSLKGIENRAYYLMDEHSYRYFNYSGTGNTVNANHSIVRRMIMDSLRYWVSEMHVDGFRFDLASILSRDETGHPLNNPPIIWEIESDPVLAGTKLIAEAWDATNLYQVGSFSGHQWKEWNGKFRDDVRSFLKGDYGALSNFASRLLASPDIYGHKQQKPEISINFVTCHDGFTMNDLVSYNYKHNQANGEDNRDGTDHNLSWNCGVEGPTDSVAIEKLRTQQIKNFFTVTLLAYGTPMLLMGDEVRRSQQGNNNAYCQDNEMSWFDWNLVEKNQSLLRFVKLITTIRLIQNANNNNALPLHEFLSARQVEWHGTQLNQPDWRPDSRSIAITAWTDHKIYMFHMMFNASESYLTFELPPIEGHGHLKWRRVIDTALESPQDINRYVDADTIHDSLYQVKAKSVVLLAVEMVEQS